MPRPPSSTTRETAEPYGAGSTVSSKGQITIPKAVRERYGLAPGTEVQFEMREEGALLLRRRPERHPAWEKIGSLKGIWRWPKGIRSVDAYVDHVRGGSYEELTGHQSRRARRK